MAFKSRNLTPYSNNVKARLVPVLWVYWNEDNDTLTTAGLIKESTMNVGDQVTAISKDYKARSNYYVSEKIGDAITLVANT